MNTALTHRKILLAVTGSIAAYKSVDLCRRLQKAGAEVRVIMSPAATKFVTPLTFATLSKHPVYTDVIGEDDWNNHVELGLWADAMVVAPCTANTLSAMAHGMANSIVTAVYLSAKCPVYYAPAMDRDMWCHPSTTRNRELLQSYGNVEIPVGHGYLASGLVGHGRMAEPQDIVSFLSQKLLNNQPLSGKYIIITAGPTQEDIDPVRFLSNRSTGTMGIAIADYAASLGAKVSLVLGPTHLRPKSESVEVVNVRSAQQMYEACAKRWTSADVGIMAAAVADYTPLDYSGSKVKKKPGDMAIELKRTIDIAGTLGKSKSDNQLLVGFALETNNALKYAQGKLTKKNFDFIVLNDLSDKGAGFGTSTNKVTIVSNNSTVPFGVKPKSEVAKDIINYIIENFYKKSAEA